MKYKLVDAIEFDKYAVKSYNAIFGTEIVPTDIREVNQLPKCDFLTFGFPCFVAGNMVLTKDGFKKIETITSDDYVLTHNNRYKKVVKTMINKTDSVYKLSTMASDDIYTTEEHPFYVRERYREWDKSKRTYARKFKEPVWVQAKNLNKNHYVGVAINKESQLPKWDGVKFNWSNSKRSVHSNVLTEKFKFKEFWWVIGRYLGDGWLRCQGGIIICCNLKQTNDITSKLMALDFNYSIVQERTANKIHISFKEIGKYVEQFGRGAKNKRLTGDILNLPTNLLQAFLEGYMSADGCFTNGLNKATSISNELIYGIGQCVSKVYKKPYSIYKTKTHPSCIIEGRLVNQNDYYTIVWKNKQCKQDNAFYENGYIWCPINAIQEQTYHGLVYNMEVEDDNSYVVQNIIVHNCQDISVAGLGKGIAKGTRSGLLFEVERLLENAKYKPKFLLMENVKNLVGIKHKADFDKWLKKLNQLGYENYYQVLNSKDYGIPQNRERVFCLSVRKDVNDAHQFPQFQFPKKQQLKLTSRDLIEEQVDNKFYLRDVVLEKIKRAKTNKFVNKKANFDGNIFDICYSPNSQEFVRTGFGDKCPTLASRDYKDPKCVQVGNVSSEKYDKMHESSRRVYSIKGIIPTLNCCGGGNLEVKILDDTYSNRKCREHKNISPTLRANRTFKVSIATNDKMTRIKRKKSKVIRKLTPKEYWRFQGFDD